MFVTHSIPEAVFLSSRVVVMSAAARAASPTIIDVDLPRPRDVETRETRRYFELVTAVREALRRGGGDLDDAGRVTGGPHRPIDGADGAVGRGRRCARAGSGRRDLAARGAVGGCPAAATRSAAGGAAGRLVEYLPAIVVFVAAIVAVWELAVGATSSIRGFPLPAPGDPRRAPGELERRSVAALTSAIATLQEALGRAR